uniref:WGS project CAEQ00000000 data, annotated contig 1086 n=1 Tax=Trypanosoma congolense (strain IL3000) TaxID=1068625 RepID=F9W3P2_TRYCI|nr:unnamed protein product [Trypanosoma congolense IL3000]
MKRDHADRKKRKTRDRSVELCSEDNNLTSGNRAPDSDALSSLLSRAKARTKKDEDGNSITLVLDEITSGDALTSQSDRRKSGRRGTKRKEIQEEGEKKDSRTLFNDFSSGDGLLARLGLIGDDDVKKKRRPKRKVRVSVSRPSDACSSKNAYQSPLDDSVAARRMTLESDPQCLREGLGEGLLVSNSALVGSSQIPPERVGGGHARRPSTKVPSSSRRGRRVGSFPKVARSSVAGSLKSYEQSEGRLSEIPSMSEGEGVTGGGTTIWEGLPKPKRGKKRSYDGGESRATEDSDEDSTYDSEETDESYESDEEEESEEETVQEKKERCETELLNYFQQLFMWRMLSARKIQCAWRCYKARLALKERQQILYRHVYRVQKAATLCIQGFLQSVVGRKKLRLTQERYMIATEERAAAENRVIKSALLIADHVAAFLERRRSERELCKLLNLSNRKELQLRCVAQTLVARWWRLVLPRKRYWQRREKEVEEARSMEFLLKKQNIAAITIQRHCRGRLCRKMVEQLKRELVQRYETRQRLLHENVDLIRLCLQEFTRRCERLALEAAHRQVKQEEAAAVIQSGWRAALRSQAINNALDHCRRTSKAVLTIQRIYRRYRNDGAVRYFRRIQQVANLDRLEREYRIYRATVRLQSFARMVLAKRSARQLRAAIGRGYFFAAAVIQAACRGGAARLQLACVRRLQRQAMELYQWLCLEQKKRIVNHVCAFLRARMSCQITEQRRCRRLSEKLLLRRVVRRQLLLDKSASIIQRGVRRWLTRRREREAEERERALRALVLSCVTRIQAVMRGFLARCDYRHRRFYAQRERQRREEMEEVAVEMWVDEWRAALLQWELDRRRVESLEKTARDVIEWCFSRASLPAAATPLVVKNVMRDTDDSDDDLDPIYSTYRDDP